MNRFVTRAGVGEYLYLYLYLYMDLYMNPYFVFELSLREGGSANRCLLPEQSRVGESSSRWLVHKQP